MIIISSILIEIKSYNTVFIRIKNSNYITDLYIDRYIFIYKIEKLQVVKYVKICKVRRNIDKVRHVS